MKSKFGLKLILSIYLFFNFSFYVYYFSGSPLSGDFKESFGSISPEILSYALLINIISLFLLLLTFYLFSLIKINRYIKIEDSFILDLIVFVVCLFYLLCVGYYGVGVAGIDESTLRVSKLLLYTYALLQPNFLIMIYLFCYYHSTRPIYWATFLLFLISSILSGATMNLILLFLLWASYSDKRRLVIFILVMGILISPLIRFLKFVVITYRRNMTSGESAEILQAVNTYKTDDMSLVDTYLFFAKATFSRFEMTSSSSFILENANKLNSLAESIGVIYPQNEYFIYNFFAKVFGFANENGAMTLQYIFAKYLSGNTDWNAQIGLAGYALISGVSALSVYILVFVLLVLTIIFSRLLKGDGSILLLTTLYIVIVLWHGWVIAYIYYFHALLIFILLIMTSRYLAHCTMQR